MKINFDLKKGTEVISGALQRTVEISEKISTDIQEKAKDLSEKNKNELYLKKLKKYNPLFPDEFYGDNFNLPNMIVIVDDAVRKGIDVCEGAIGWLSNEKGMEILHLYDEEIEKCGIKFIPAAICDAVYYVDRFDRKKFIQTECIFGKANEERLAELEHIAYSLGAKRCTIEISESSVEIDSGKKKMSTKEKASIHGIGVSSETSVEQDFGRKETIQRRGKSESCCEGSNEAKMPQLKLFANDDTIKRLIEMRLENVNSIKNKTLILEGSASATMSQKTAVAIDDAIGKIGISGKANMEGQALRENQSKLIFNIEF